MIDSIKIEKREDGIDVGTHHISYEELDAIVEHHKQGMHTITKDDAVWNACRKRGFDDETAQAIAQRVYQYGWYGG